MKAAIEQELKYSLTPEEHEKLLHSLRKLKRIRKVQTNVYFDTTDLDLRKKRIALRVRFYRDAPAAILTFKRATSGRSSSMKGFKQREEQEITISLAKARKMVKGFSLGLLAPQIKNLLKKEFSSETLSEVKPLGRVQNKRVLIHILPRLILEVDHYTVFGRHFYELEIETSRPKAVDQWVRKTFKKNKIKYKPEETSKLKRFLEIWEKKKK